MEMPPEKSPKWGFWEKRAKRPLLDLKGTGRAKTWTSVRVRVNLKRLLKRLSSGRLEHVSFKSKQSRNGPRTAPLLSAIRVPVQKRIQARPASTILENISFNNQPYS